jgi:hypothetical protein
MAFATVTKSKAMIVCTAFVAVIALAVLAPLRAAATTEKRMNRAAELLATRADADSLAAAGLLGYRMPHDQSLRLVAQASLLAPERADLAWMHIQLCEADAACDPEPLEIRFRDLDEENGAGWFGALARASKRGDEEAKLAALAAIGRSERVDLYWTTLFAHLSRQVASARTAPLHEAQMWVAGVLAAVAIPGLGDVSRACSVERLTRDDVMEVCRGVANSLLNGDTYLIESLGASLAKRAWPANSAKWLEAAAVPRTFDHRIRFAGDFNAWVEANANDHLDLLEKHRREQDVNRAVLIAMGKSPEPHPAE